MASVFFAGGGVPWPVLFDRLEPFTGAAFALLVLSRHVAPLSDGFDNTARHTALVLLLGALFMLANVSGLSLLAFAPSTAQIVYQVVFVPLSIALLWRALRTGDSRGATLTAVAFALFILVRYFDWFWDWIPAWAFFVVLAGMAFASIALLRRVRHRPETEAI
jgi:uncharacterized membrane protein